MKVQLEARRLEDELAYRRRQRELAKKKKKTQNRQIAYIEDSSEIRLDRQEKDTDDLSEREQTVQQTKSVEGYDVQVGATTKDTLVDGNRDAGEPHFAESNTIKQETSLSSTDIHIESVNKSVASTQGVVGSGGNIKLEEAERMLEHLENLRKRLQVGYGEGEEEEEEENKTEEER